MTYTVSSGMLNSTIPYHTTVWILVFCPVDGEAEWSRFFIHDLESKNQQQQHLCEESYVVGKIQIRKRLSSQYYSNRPSYLMCTTIRGVGTEGIEPAEEWKCPRHMQHSPRAAEVRGYELRGMAHFDLSVCLEQERHSWRLAQGASFCPSTKERAAGTTARTIGHHITFCPRQGVCPRPTLSSAASGKKENTAKWLHTKEVNSWSHCHAEHAPV